MYNERNFRNNGGYNSRPNGHGYDDRNYGRGGYDNRGREMMDHPFEINEVVRHKATGARLVVIRYGREQVECRKPDLSADYFYLYELEPMTDAPGMK